MTDGPVDSKCAPICDQLFNAADCWETARRNLKDDQANPVLRAKKRDADKNLSKVVGTARYVRRQP